MNIKWNQFFQKEGSVVVQLLSPVRLSATSWTTTCQASLPFTVSQSLLTSCQFSQWCHPNISSSVIPFSSCLQSFPASGSFPVSQFFVSGGQSIEASASASVLPVNIQGWFPYDWLVWSPCSLRVSDNVSCCICLFQVAFLYCFVFWIAKCRL